MIALLQLIKLLNPEQREMLKEFLLEPDEGFGAYELAEALEYFFHAHYEIDIELTESQKDSIMRVIGNGSVKSAFAVTEMV
jgi:hypothetical protein